MGSKSVWEELLKIIDECDTVESSKGFEGDEIEPDGLKSRCNIGDYEWTLTVQCGKGIKEINNKFFLTISRALYDVIFENKKESV